MPTSIDNQHPHPRRRRPFGERGASLVEMSLVLIPFLTLVFGIIEFSYAAAQNGEVRHLAEEGARTAAVGNDPASVICGSEVTLGPVTYTLEVRDADVDDRDMQVLEVRAPFRSLTRLVPEGWDFVSEQAFYVEPQYDLETAGPATCS